MELVKKIFFIVERVTRSKRFWALFIIFFLMLSSSGEQTQDGYMIEDETKNYEYKLLDGSKDSKNKILSIRIDGIIYDQRISSNPFLSLEQNATYGSEIKSMLVRAAKDNNIKAVLLEINSPGGTITGSKAISEGVEYYKSVAKKPVYAHISGEGLSGGYWAAASTEQIVADQGSFVGSIGVILGPFKQYKDVVSEGDFAGSVSTDGGIDTYYITGGKYKDTGSPYRAMSDEESKHWQSVVNGGYNMFLKHVSENRGLTNSYIQDTIKALPYETSKAQDFKLIDAIGSRDYTINLLVKKAGLRDDYQVIQQSKKGGFWDDVFSAASFIKPTQVETTCRLCGKPLFIYMPAVSTATMWK